MTDSIQILGSRHGGGAERFFVRLVTALNARGHRALAVVPPESWAARKLPDEVPKQHLRMRSIWDVAARLGIRKIVRRERPPIVQTWLGRATRLTRLPANGSPVHVTRLGGYYKLNGYRHAHAWVGNTRGIRDYLLQAGLPETRVFHIGNFIELPPALPVSECMAFRARHDIPCDAWLLLSIGRLHPCKGFADLIDALSALPTQHQGRPLHLAIAGDGPLREALHAHAAASPAASRIHWLGWIDQPNLALQAADLFVCPSREEALGNVILEAWANRVPAVATRTAGATELIEPGVSGLLCDIGAPSDLAGKLGEALAMTEGERDAMIAAGRRRIIEVHSEEAIVNAYLDLYRKLSSSPDPS